MATRNQNGRNISSPDETPGWRPQQDQSMRHRDDRETGSDRDEGYRASERYGQGQSGYGAGRAGEDRAMSTGSENRNQSYGGGRYEDRDQGIGGDDRFSGRGGQGYYQDRSGHDRGGHDRGGHDRGAQSWSGGREGYGHQDEGLGQRGYGGAENRGYNSGYNQGGQGGQGQQGGFGGYSADRGPQQRGPHRGKGPQGYQRSDERIREMVCEALTDDEHVDASMIVVVVSSGEVTLTGEVPDRQMKRMAEDTVERVSGVRDIQNQLRVASSNDGKQARGRNEPDERKPRA